MKYIILTLGIFFSACSTEHIYYSYSGTTITRIDDGTDTYFYYGIFEDKDNLPKSYIKTTYKGRDGYMEGYLVFKDSGYVDLIRSGGIYDSVNLGRKLRVIRFEDNAESIKWNKEKKENYKNVCQVSSDFTYEVKRNKMNKSEVKVEYPE